MPWTLPRKINKRQLQGMHQSRLWASCLRQRSRQRMVTRIIPARPATMTAMMTRHMVIPTRLLILLPTHPPICQVLLIFRICCLANTCRIRLLITPELQKAVVAHTADTAVELLTPAGTAGGSYSVCSYAICCTFHVFYLFGSCPLVHICQWQ